MAFKEMRLDVREMFGGSGGGSFVTIISTDDLGNEQREQTQDRDRGEWTIMFPAKKPDHFKPFVSFFKVAAGRANTWRFKDWGDFEAASGEGVLTTITTNTTYQMWKRYTFAGYTFDSKIVLPITSTIAVAGGGTYTVGATGIITRTGGSNPTGWSGEFDRLCRFDTDKLNRTIIDKSGGEIWLKLDPIVVREVIA